MPAGIIFQKTGRRMTYEYSLVGGVNDTREDAKALAGLLRGQNCHVNLIPVNPVKEKGYVQPGPPRRCWILKISWKNTGSMRQSEEKWEEILTVPADSCAEAMRNPL